MALDAKAAQITIETKEAGLEMIRVTDDGEGIEADDVETAFKRHATSKITSREDLFRVVTLGFRGEALPSIASVSDVVLMTAHAGDETGNDDSYQGRKNRFKRCKSAQKRNADNRQQSVFQHAGSFEIP